MVRVQVAEGAVGALVSQYHPLLAEPITRYLAQPFSPVRLLGVGEHVVGGALIGSAIAYFGLRATRTGTAHPQPSPLQAAQAQPEPGAPGTTKADAGAAFQRRALLVLLSVVGAVVVAVLCVVVAGAIVGPRVVRTADEWRRVQDGESVEIRGTVGHNYNASPFFPIDMFVVLDGKLVVDCNFDSAVWETSSFREWRDALPPGSPVAVRGIAHRTPAELKRCRPVPVKK